MKTRYGLDLFYHKKKTFAVKLVIASFSVAAAIVFSFLFIKFVRNKIFNLDSVDSMYENWALHTEDGYKAVYNAAMNILEKNPYHNAALAFSGYSSFMLAESETDSVKSQELLEKSIFSLRKAMHGCRKNALPQIQYMLGRAYFYKNKVSAYHYYADLAVKYLTLSVSNGYKSADIPLLLGLSYASLGETDESIAAFTEALLVRETDTLLFNIAKQYCANGQEMVAKQYLVRVLETSQNEDLLDDSHILLGQIYTGEGNFSDAEKEFDSILEKNSNSADAHYGLGVLYEKKGDTIKARAEWRKCLKIQFNHKDALKKMSEL
ncbi:tetratricopeptide repeat protein [Treponema sp.]|uniref:tetratricopeptide repeat protein n=1 Tax=Treponema sp. TaxID=166 RepID=UPI003F0D4DF2